ncbi:DMT family transporter, partial [Micromonospora sp. ATA51]|nr:DMT family transporter [Micromonospora sp. ATA51]
RRGRHLAATSWQLVAGGLLIVPLAAAVEGAPAVPDRPALLGYAWLGLVGTAGAYALWFRGVALLPVTRVSVLGALSPLTAAAFGWLVLGQALGPVQLAGFVVAVTAMVVGQLPGQPASNRRQSGPSRSTRSGSAPGDSSAAAARGRTNRCTAAGPAASDSSSIQRTSSTVQPSPARPAISRTSRRPTRVSSS